MSLVGPSNPFASRMVRPGAIPFQFGSGGSCRVIFERLRDNNFWGQILGPHGSGKSTLLATLEPHWHAWGRQPRTFVLRDGQTRLPYDAAETPAWTPQTQVIVDGYEQLSWYSRWRLHRRVRRRGAGLLVTSHAPAGFQTVWETQTSLQLVQCLLEHLPPAARQMVGPSDLQQAYRSGSGNIRECWFQLYDVYERAVHTGSAPGP